MKLTIISVTFGHTTELDVFIGSMLLQTCRDWTLEVWHDGVPPAQVSEIMKRYIDDDRIVLRHSDKRHGLWGHLSRQAGLAGLRCDDGDFVLITNADNYLTPDFVKQMLGGIQENTGIMMCDCIHSHASYGYHTARLFEGGIDMTEGIVRADIAKKVGFPWTHFSADGAYFVECAKECKKMGLVAMHINKALVVHN